MTSEAYRLRDEALAEAQAAAMEGRVAALTDTGRSLIGPSWYKDRYEAPDADSPLSGLYEVNSREKKLSGWVYPYQHPRGVLTNPCPTCGYEYGSKWQFEPVPGEVLDWFAALPDADYAPAWV